MKYIYKLSAIIIIAAVITLMLPGTVFATETQKYPTSIGGLPVVLVENSANTAGISEGKVVLCLYDSTSKSLEESQAKLNSSKYLLNFPLPKGWEIEVFGGSGSSIEKFLTAYKINNEFVKEYGPLYLGPPPGDMISNGATNDITVTDAIGSVNSIMSVQHMPSWALFQNQDTVFRTINYQSACWFQPVVGVFPPPPPQEYCAILNNLQTNGNSSSHFLQVGQAYQSNGMALNGYSSQAFNFQMQIFNITTNPGDLMKFELYYSSFWDGYWTESCKDITQNIWIYHPDWSITGTQAQTLPAENTSIWFENWFTTSNWWNGYTNPIGVFGAQDGTLNNPVAWSYDQMLIEDNMGYFHPNNGQIVGNIINGGYACWCLNTLLLGR